jgi:hypothetical protein
MLTFTTIDFGEVKVKALFSRRARRDLHRTAKAIIHERLMAEMEVESTLPPLTYTQTIGAEMEVESQLPPPPYTQTIGEDLAEDKVPRGR